MKKYAIMINPGHNRIYFEASKGLAIAELKIAMNNFAVSEIKEESIGGLFYITFDVETELDGELLFTVGKLSFAYAIFEVIGEYLRPITKSTADYLDGDISSMLKYVGKTNELFTKLMINVGLMTLQRRENVKLLDPIAGKGTTLFEGLSIGLDVYGVEINEKSAEESYQFLRKYLENKKLKHKVKTMRVSGKNREFTAMRYSIDILKDKEGENCKKYEMVGGSTLHCDSYFPQNTFDLVVGDLPYGVQHGSVTQPKQGGLTRNPTELLTLSLPVWYKMMKADGVVVLSWNSFLIDRKSFADILEGNNFTVLNSDGYGEFSHRVDQAIMRDLIVGVKKIKN